MLRYARLGKLLLAPQASGREPFSWFLASDRIDRLVICAQEGGRLLQQTSLGAQVNQHSAMHDCSCLLCMQAGAEQGVGAHPVSALYPRRTDTRLRLPASIAGNVPLRLLF
jgi:hypothetical protein